MPISVENQHGAAVYVNKICNSMYLLRWWCLLLSTAQSGWMAGMYRTHHWRTFKLLLVWSLNKWPQWAQWKHILINSSFIWKHSRRDSCTVYHSFSIFIFFCPEPNGGKKSFINWSDIKMDAFTLVIHQFGVILTSCLMSEWNPHIYMTVTMAVVQITFNMAQVWTERHLINIKDVAAQGKTCNN